MTTESLEQRTSNTNSLNVHFLNLILVVHIGVRNVNRTPIACTTIVYCSGRDKEINQRSNFFFVSSEMSLGNWLYELKFFVSLSKKLSISFTLLTAPWNITTPLRISNIVSHTWVSSGSTQFLQDTFGSFPCATRIASAHTLYAVYSAFRLAFLSSTSCFFTAIVNCCLPNPV